MENRSVVVALLTPASCGWKGGGMLASRAVRSAIAAVVVLAGAAGVGSGAGSKAPAAVAVWHVVVLGDSGASGRGDPTGLAWGGRYGRLLRQKFGRKVSVANLALEGESSSGLLERVRSNAALRATIRNSDIILFSSTAGADLNEADARLQAKRCRGKDCYASALRAWARSYRRIVATAAALRGKRKTVLRGVTEPNVVPGATGLVPRFVTVQLGLYQARLIRHAVCRTMTAHGGRCIDVLTAFNGANGTRNAYKSGLLNKGDCCYPSAKGQELMAKLLLGTGLAPLR